MITSHIEALADRANYDPFAMVSTNLRDSRAVACELVLSWTSNQLEVASGRVQVRRCCSLIQTCSCSATPSFHSYIAARMSPGGFVLQQGESNPTSMYVCQLLRVKNSDCNSLHNAKPLFRPALLRTVTHFDLNSWEPAMWVFLRLRFFCRCARTDNGCSVSCSAPGSFALATGPDAVQKGWRHGTPGRPICIHTRKHLIELRSLQQRRYPCAEHYGTTPLFSPE